MKQIDLPQSDKDMATLVRQAIAAGEPMTIFEAGRPVLDLVPRFKSWARFFATSPKERAAAGAAMEKIRANVHSQPTIVEIIASKHEGHSR